MNNYTPKILPIVVNPNDILRKKSQPIAPEKISADEFKKLCADMRETMIKKDGVGLAAPQIGRNQRLIVVSAKQGPQCLINPEIIKRSFMKDWGEEGCLSVPGKFGQVKRHKSVICKYYGEDGEQKILDASGFMARVLQHEIDHLDGILFIDKARKIKEINNG